LLANDHDAVMIPIPQYPIYSALITLLCGRQVGYELNEDEGWSVSREQLETQLKISQSEGLTIKAMAMINPGNPTGQVLDEEDVATICQFCADHGIVLLSDEVYQRNVYAKGKKVSSVDLMCLLKCLTLLTRPHHYPFSSIAPKRWPCHDPPLVPCSSCPSTQPPRASSESADAVEGTWSSITSTLTSRPRSTSSRAADCAAVSTVRL
jgi:hypothetical protein